MMERTIISTSNSSLDSHPNNTLTKFVHVLPEPLLLNKPHCIALTKISLSHKVKKSRQLKKLGFIKIHLEELNPHERAIDSANSQCIALAPYPKEIEERATIFWHFVENPIFIDIPYLGTLRQLTFSLTDQDNTALILEPGAATVISLAVKEMNFHSQFTVVASAATSSMLFANNRHDLFTTSFTSPISLDGEWEVALHSITVPKGLTLGDYQLYIVDDATGSVLKRWEIDYKPNPTKKEFIATLKKWGVEYSERNDRAYIQKTSDSKLPGEHCNLRMNRRMLAVFNIAKSYSVFNITNSPTLLGTIESESILPPLAEHLFLYLDVVEPSIIGNAFTQFFQIIPSAKVGLFQHDTDFYFEVKNLEYRKVAKKLISRMTFQLSSLDGHKIEFLNVERNDGIKYNLHFRQVQKGV